MSVVTYCLALVRTPSRYTDIILYSLLLSITKDTLILRSSLKWQDTLARFELITALSAVISMPMLPFLQLITFASRLFTSRTANSNSRVLPYTRKSLSNGLKLMVAVLPPARCNAVSPFASLSQPLDDQFTLSKVVVTSPYSHTAGLISLFERPAELRSSSRSLVAGSIGKLNSFTVSTTLLDTSRKVTVNLTVPIG